MEMMIFSIRNPILISAISSAQSPIITGLVDSTLNWFVLRRQNELVGPPQHCTSVITTPGDYTDDITLSEASHTSCAMPKVNCKKKSSQILDPSLSVVDLNPDSELHNVKSVF